MGPQTSSQERRQPKIWWSNAIFFVLTHIAAILGVYFTPWSSVHRLSLTLAFLTWQLADFGITVGYHRLYSHRAFRANVYVRMILAALGSAGFQGSIKWWCLRHRLHHRFTDDPIHDPYAATKGLFYSHMGWIFYRPLYEKMDLVDRQDLDNDIVVRLQHKYYVPIALFLGFILPTILGSLWNDPWGSFIWAGLLARLFIWHSTFLVNSLAHWDGLQPYSDENTSRGNLLLALMTGGEGNHNFHAFPHDFRSGPSAWEWDPSKWIIILLHRFRLASRLRRARPEDMKEAKAYMYQKRYHHHHSPPTTDDEQHWDGPTWSIQEISDYAATKKARCVLILNGYAVDVSSYMAEHPGGATLMRQYAVSTQKNNDLKETRDASWAFGGGLNNHSRAARRQMRELRVAKVQL